MNDEIVREFLVESKENLDSLDRELVHLEGDPRNRDTLASIFRTIHTIKGTCSFLGFTKLESVAHVGENLLSKLRDGELELSSSITTALLAMVDAIRQMLDSIESSGSEGERNDKALIDTLVALQQGTGAAPPNASTAASGDALVRQPLAADPSAEPIGELPVAPDTATQRADAQPATERRDGDPTRIGETLAEHGSVKLQDAAESLPAQQAARGTVSEASIRVDVGLLDKLMNLVGELVLARNQIVQFTNTVEDSNLIAPSQRLNLITTELQEGVMKTRMQPIGNIWSKFPRTVRDVAVSCGKLVRIEMEGKETELDKTIIESIKDPLTHLVRNAVDHGIEAPEQRSAAGKPAEGRLFLRAYHEGGQVNIEITDDGKGLDCERIRRKAVERGLIPADQAARMSEREIANLIFLPGFSTAEKVTNVSGRGVGMDVVKTNIEKIGGTVDVQSKVGTGTTVKMKIPLTLAIIPALIVTSGGDRYAIPQVSLLELVRIEEEEAKTAIEYVHRAPVYRLRGHLLPLVYLNDALKIGDQTNDGKRDRAVNIIVLQADDRQFGLVVDEINDTEEIVVKPLGKQLKSVNTFAGATIMGDGKVALILDVMGLAQQANVISESRDRSIAEKDAAASKEAGVGRKQTFLLFRTGKDNRMAVELSLVARLEEFTTDKIETAGDHRVVQYRGKIMPLVHVSEALNATQAAAASSDAGTIQVVVYSENGRSVGLVVDHILDIVEETVAAQHSSKRSGLLGSAIIQQHVTNLVDVRGLIRTTIPAFFDHPSVGEEQRQ